MLKFKVKDRYSRRPACANTAYLVRDSWDDFGFKTTYNLVVFDKSAQRFNLGYVKIARIDQQYSNEATEIPDEFEELDNCYFSLGQGDEFYQEVGNFEASFKTALLTSIQDVVFDLEKWNTVKHLEVTRKSLLRGVTSKSIEGQYRRLLSGEARLTEYKFSFSASLKDPNHLSFEIEPESTPPTNIHVLIGRNGTGKTHLLRSMLLSAINSHKSHSHGIFQSEETEGDLFANIVFVSFSAFDEFEIPQERANSADKIGFSFIGLSKPVNGNKKPKTPKGLKELRSEFISAISKCQRSPWLNRWRDAIRIIESDPRFLELRLLEYIKEEDDEEGRNIGRHFELAFNGLSSGHRAVLLTLTRLVETVEEQSLVLIDEPENHLHPPLLSAFIRAVSNLMINRNGVAIIATHSPVVLQEVPKSCVWCLDRFGETTQAKRLERETFGENLGTLTHQVFGYEVTNSGFHKMLVDAAEEHNDFEDAQDSFSGQLGAEAQAILRALITIRNQKTQP